MSIGTPSAVYSAITTSGGTSMASPSFTPVANQLYGFAAYANADNLTGISSSGMSWAQVDKVGIAGRTVYLYTGVGASPGSGAVTVAFSGATYARGIIFTITGTVLTGTAGADAWGTPQHQASYGTSHTTPSIAAFQTGSILIAAGFHEQNQDVVPSGSLQLLVQTATGGNGDRLAVFYQMTQNLTPNFTAANSQYGGIIGVELKAAAAATDVADRGMARGLQRGIARGVVNAMGMVRDGLLWRPKEQRLVVPVGIALEGV